jgi:hypothetical protein
MADYLSDDEVFGGSTYLSDAEVFGGRKDVTSFKVSTGDQAARDREALGILQRERENAQRLAADAQKSGNQADAVRYAGDQAALDREIAARAKAAGVTVPAPAAVVAPARGTLALPVRPGQTQSGVVAPEPTALAPQGKAPRMTTGTAVAATESDGYVPIIARGIKDTTDKSKQPGFMLQPGFIAEVRQSFADIPAEKRLVALQEAAKGTDLRARAAQQILLDTQKEDENIRLNTESRRGLIDLIAKGKKVKAEPSPPETKPPPPAPVTFPDVAPKVFDSLDPANRALSEEARVKRALELDAARRGVNTADTSIEAIADRERAAKRDLAAEAYAKKNPVQAALFSGGARTISGIANAVPTIVDFAARVTGLAGDEGVRAPTYEFADRLAVKANSAMPEAGKQSMDDAWKKGEFGQWLGLNMVAQAPNIAANFVATVFPPARPFVLPAMGAQTAGQAYGEGDSSFGALLKGGAEIAGEKITFGVFDRTMASLSKLPLSLQAATVQSVGKAFAATGKAVTAQGVAGAVEESATTIIQNGVDKYVEGKNKKLLDGVAEAAVLGAAMEGPLAIPQAAAAFKSGQREFANAFQADVDARQANAEATDLEARRAMSPNKGAFDANVANLRTATADALQGLLTPLAEGMAASRAYEDQLRAERDQADLQRASTAGDAATAADNLSGSLDEMLEPALTGAAVPAEVLSPEPGLIGAEMTAAADRAEPGLFAAQPPVEVLPTEPGLTGVEMAAAADRAEPDLTGAEVSGEAPGTEPELFAQAAASVPEAAAGVNPDLEQKMGFDKLRLNAPRPQTIQGTPVADLSDDQLQTMAGDESIAPISRRSAAIELTARQAEPGAFTQRAAPQATGAPSTVSYAGETLDTSRTTFGLGDAQGRVSDAPVTGAGAAARTELQARLDRAAAIHGVAVPTLAAPTPENEAAVSVVADALGGVGLVDKVVAYSDPDGADGFELGGVVAVNTESQKGIAHTSFHEGFHIAERIAAADTAAGRTNTPAQQYVASIHGLFDEMSDEGKRAYISNFLNTEELDAIQDPVAREARITEMLTEPKTRSEMTADFMGNRATDKNWLASLAKADPKGFGDFVKKWIGILDGMIARLRGVTARSNLESIKVDEHLKDLNRAKMVARDALVAYRNGTLQQLAPTTTPPAMSLRQGERNAISTGNQNVPGAPAPVGRVSGEDGGGPTPSYGTARAGAISVVGRHYSTAPRQSLSGGYYGQGLKGAERDRLDRSTDPRLKSRIYFYVDQGAGVRPESGVGGYAHETRLDNVYDPQTRIVKPQADFNAFESAVINAGFDGYIAPFGNNQSAVVLLGQKHKAVPVKAIGQPAAAAPVESAPPSVLKKGLMSKELSQIDTSNIPGARVRAGSLEIPAEQRDAANAELERIGSEVRFAKKEKVTPARVMFEVAPDPNDVDLKARWDAVPFERKSEISQSVAKQIMPQVFKLAGVRARLTTQLGGYLEDTSPSFAAIVPSTASAQQLMEMARIGGFGLTQDSMMVLDSKPFEGSSPTGLITITLPENMKGQEAVHSVYQAARQVSPEDITGHTTVGQEMVLAVPSDKMADLTSKIVGVLNARPENFNIDSANGHMAFVPKEEYDYGSETRKSTPEFSAKRAEANRIREEASAALEREIATYEGTGGRKIDTGVYRNVADSFGLSQAEYEASALPLMLGGVKDKTFRAPNIGEIPEIVQWLDQRRADTGLPKLDINKPEDRTTLAKLMASEAVAAIRSAGNAVEWYDETVAKTLRIMAVKYPELDTDPNARNAFLIAVAISSQTMDVEANLKYASEQYETYRASVNAQGVGKFPEVGKGKSAPPMAKNFALANDVLADMGPDLLLRFLQTEFTKRELETIGFPIGGESMDEKVLGSAIFGPKIGFGFYSNLSGNFEPITMDMWFMRTVGRLAGTLPAFDPVLFPKQVAKLRAALAETGEAGRGVYADQFDPALVKAAMETDEGAIALARRVSSVHNRQFIKERAAFDSGTRIKTSLVGASGAILKSADKPTDSPSSGGERQRLRDVTRQMVAIVEEQTGKRVPPAALQALIWYPEQELYKKLGAGLRVTSQDYAGAAESLLTKEGFNGKQLRTAAESGPGQARQVAGEPVARADQQAGQPSKSTGAFQGAERETFIAARTPLETIFDGLNKRGLAKTRAESAIELRPDGAQIKYVHENFLDILSELDDSGLVKINCK